jgi:hypothetical protein
MTKTSKISRIILVFVLAGGLLAALLFWKADPLNLRSPSDQELIAIFHNHREVFERLHQMLSDDMHNAPKNKSGVKQLKAKQSPEYKRLVAELYPGLEAYIDWDESINFVFARGMIAAIGPGWTKGIYYTSVTDQPNGTLLQNLDNARTFAPGVYLRQIEPHWFIVYQRDE